MFTPRVSDDVRATRLASKLMRFCVSGDALETMRAAPPEPPATTRLNAPLGVFSMGAPLVSSGRNCICPEICCRASRCWLPKARAFAVTATSCVDAGVIGSIHRPSFRAAGRQRHQPIPDIAHCEQRAAGRISVACSVERLRILRVAMALECTKLARGQHPRICSEGDVKHGFGGDMQRSSGAPLPRCPTSAFRRCLACC